MGDPSIMRVMTTGGTAQDARRSAGFRRPTEAWAIDVERRRHVTALLDDLPSGFVVFHDLRLPKPSTTTVDHLVIGPRSIWCVTTATYDDPITAGVGRGADTLWAGRTPLRSVLESCESYADTIASLIDRPVEPLLCAVAPEVPESSSGPHGITICTPDTLAAAVATSTTDWQDVGEVARIVTSALAAEPARDSALPTLGSTAASTATRSASRGPSLVGGVVRFARRHLPLRRVVPIALLVAALTVVPNLLGIGTSVAQRGVEVGVESVTDVLTPSTLVSQAAGDDTLPAPAPVRYDVTCPTPGSGWTVDWIWPGDLAAGAAAYGIRTRSDDGVVRNHSPGGWSSPNDAPPPSRIDTSNGPVTVITEYRDAAGAVISTGEQAFSPPADGC